MGSRLIDGPIFVWVLFLMVGIVISALGLNECLGTARWIRATLPADAVVEEAEVYGEDEGKFYDFLVQFNANTGEQIRTSVRQTVNGLLITTPRIGQTVPVRYKPTNPESAKLATWDELWFNAAGMTIFGLIFSGISIGLIMRTEANGHGGTRDST